MNKGQGKQDKAVQADPAKRQDNTDEQEDMLQSSDLQPPPVGDHLADAKPAPGVTTRGHQQGASREQETPALKPVVPTPSFEDVQETFPDHPLAALRQRFHPTIQPPLFEAVDLPALVRECEQLSQKLPQEERQGLWEIAEREIAEDPDALAELRDLVRDKLFPLRDWAELQVASWHQIQDVWCGLRPLSDRDLIYKQLEPYRRYDMVRKHEVLLALALPRQEVPSWAKKGGH